MLVEPVVQAPDLFPELGDGLFSGVRGPNEQLHGLSELLCLVPDRLDELPVAVAVVVVVIGAAERHIVVRLDLDDRHPVLCRRPYLFHSISVVGGVTGASLQGRLDGFNGPGDGRAEDRLDRVGRGRGETDSHDDVRERVSGGGVRGGVLQLPDPARVHRRARDGCSVLIRVRVGPRPSVRVCVRAGARGSRSRTKEGFFDFVLTETFLQEEGPLRLLSAAPDRRVQQEAHRLLYLVLVETRRGRRGGRHRRVTELVPEKYEINCGHDRSLFRFRAAWITR